MTFTVTYRDKTGQSTSECFDAEDRSELFKVLKERGINAIRIEEGAKKVSRSSSGSSSSALKKLLAALVLVAVCGAMVVIFLPSDEPAPVEEKKPVKKTPVQVLPGSTNRTPVAKKPQEPAKKPEKPVHVKKPGTMQTPDGRVLTFPIPAPGEFRIVHSKGQMFKCDHEGNWEDITPKPVFDNAFEENLIGMNLENGNFIPGMLLGLDKDQVMKMLKKPVTIDPEDSEDVIRKKTAAAEVKQLALDYMETTGASFDDFVMEMRNVSTIQRGLTASTLKDIVGFLKKGDAKSAALYRDTLNEKFKEMGLPAAKIPKPINDIIDANNIPE